MALLKSDPYGAFEPVLEGDGVVLRLPRPSDYPAWSMVRAESRAFLTPWEPSWARDELSRPAWRRRLKAYQAEVKAGEGYPFFLFRNVDGALIGGVRLSNIRRGVQQCCSVGYWMGERFAGQGYMTAGVRAVVPFVFDELGLHRLEAACLPHNEASKRVLERVGFRREGLARQYLRINGQWQDHVLYGLVRGDPASGVRV